MKILSCGIRPLSNSMSHKVPVTAILDYCANCNIIGILYEINLSFQSKYNELKQVEVTDVFITNKPELESVLILDQLWFQENAMKVDFPNKTLTLLDGTSCEVKYN
ncbi:4125_t:CDS:2 [Funneliformis caledonium]|uniref:4125_t:CDS:1 n=1 Tax=Funneliformis caledonium TaxID=1117310 RepID=A0A9N8V8S1_9GLOM|nr:4125_t:CDS:2 [Funneliformis caledonium]